MVCNKFYKYYACQKIIFYQGFVLDVFLKFFKIFLRNSFFLKNSDVSINVCLKK